MIQCGYEASRPWTFLCWEFFNQFQFQCLWLICSNFLFLTGSVLGDCTFLRICLFLPGCPFSWGTIAVAVSYDPLYFCGNFSLFMSNFIDLSLLPLFLDESLLILFIFSKNQLLVSLIFAIALSQFCLFLLSSLWFLSFKNFRSYLFFCI